MPRSCFERSPLRVHAVPSGEVTPCLLITMGFGRCSATLVIAIRAERGLNSLLTIAPWLLPRAAGPGGAYNMSVILSLLGIAIAAAGVAAIGFGIPINEFTLGTTLIVAGVSALTGGLILIGLAAVVAELGRLGEAIRTRPVVRAAGRSVEPPELVPPAAGSAVASITPARPAPSSPRPRAETPQVRAPESPATIGTPGREISAAADRLERASAEQGEPSIVAEEEEVPLSPNGTAPVQTHRPSGVEAAPPEPKVSSEDRAGGTAVEALKASRLDFLFRSKPARPVSQRGNFDAVWPADTRPGKRVESGSSLAVEAAQRQADDSADDSRQQAADLTEPRAAAVLKSGVVDGMAYTLYADGSIEAKLPHGTVKFGSIAELRAHIENNS
jgi:hypothetical protein